MLYYTTHTHRRKRDVHPEITPDPGTAIRLPRPGHQRLLALSLLCVAWRQALSGAASAMIRHQPPACAVIGHHHRHRRPRFALRAAGHRRGRTNGRLSALPISPSCQPFLQPTMGCRPPKAHGAAGAHVRPRPAVYVVIRHHHAQCGPHIVLLVPPDIVAGGPTGAFRHFLSVSLALSVSMLPMFTMGPQ